MGHLQSFSAFRRWGDSERIVLSSSLSLVFLRARVRGYKYMIVKMLFAICTEIGGINVL